MNVQHLSASKGQINRKISIYQELGRHVPLTC